MKHDKEIPKANINNLIPVINTKIHQIKSSKFRTKK